MLYSPFLPAVIVAVAGVALLPWVLHQPTRIRVGIGLVYLALYTTVLARADILPNRPVSDDAELGGRLLAQGLQLLWWFAFARWLIAVGRAFLLYKHKLEERKFATDMLAGIVYLAVCFALAGLVFGLPLTGLLATSGVVAIVLGLALQSTMSDLFSGVALTLERAYRIGDFINLEGDVHGRVIEITWRATHIMRGSQDAIIVPNSVIAKSRIVNYSYPLRIHGVNFEVSLGNRTAPERAIAILDQALLQCRSVLRSPRPTAQASHLGTAAIKYSVTFFVDRFESAGQAKNEVLALIYAHAQWAGIQLGRQRSDVLPGPPVSGLKDRPPAQSSLDRTAIFAGLSAAERQAIAAKMSRRAFRDGDFVCEEGQPGDSLFLVEAGVVSVSHKDESGMSKEIARLGPGDFFGTNAAQQGSPRNVTVRALAPLTLFELGRENIPAVVWEHPDIRGRVDSLAKRLSAERVTPGDALLDGRGGSGSRVIEQFVRLFKGR